MAQIGESEKNEELSTPSNLDVTDVEEGPASEEEEWKHGKQELIILLTLAAVSFIVAMDSTILVPALPTLTLALNGTAIETFWTGTSYLLANAVFLPFIGAASEVFGRRGMLMMSLGFFTLGTILCCVANNFDVLLAGRTVQGIGGGGITTLSTIILSDIIPLRQRPKYQSVVLLAWGMGTILGPLIGGLFAQHTTWRWLFYINFPFCAIGLFVVPFTVKLKTPIEDSLLNKLLRVDWVGGGLFITGVSSFLLGLTWAGVQYKWAAFQSWLPIVLGVVAIVLSLLYEKRFPVQPFLRLSVFNSVSAYIAFFCAVIQGLLLYAGLYYNPLYLSAVKGLNPTLTGVCILAVNSVFFPICVISGVVMSRRGTFLWSLYSGWAFSTLGMGLLLICKENTPVVGAVFIYIVGGIGQGLLIVSLNLACQSIAAATDVAHAISMYTFMRTLGMCLGVAIGGTVFQNVMIQKLADRGLPESIAAEAENFVATLNAMPAGEEKDAYLAVYVGAFHGVYYVLLALSALCLVLTFCIRHHNMDKELVSEHKLKDRQKARQDAAEAST